MITLVIVDCQNDFITGTMSVKSAKNTVEEIKKYIKNHKKEIEKILFTADWHPYDHCSFKKYGGEWVHHCIQYTPGACIEPKLLKYVQSFDIPYQVSTRGEDKFSDPKGPFMEIEFSQDDSLVSKYYFDSIVEADAGTEFVVTGIANAASITIKNMLENEITPKVFMPGIISNDGGRTFSEFVKLNKLEKIA